jgi:hypothetical protein
VTKAKSHALISDEIMGMMSVDDLGDTLKRQILELAIASDNPQFKLDAYKATVERGKARPADTSPAEADAMTQFRARVRTAAEVENGAE